MPADKPLKDNLRKRTSDDLRDERDQLGGWIRQPAVRWLDPSILAKAGVEVAVSGTFGKFADKREIQTQPQGPLVPPAVPAPGDSDAFDYSTSGELWIDYLSDTGDGWPATQTMAWVLAQPSLTVDDSELPRGRILLLGGDQVYPTATPEAYEDRFKGPFAAALPRSERGREPDMYAVPGNHDWYDGLVSFLRLFCANGWIGGWRTRQRRSYFALKLPNRWWIWAIDIQLDTYIDDVQLQYFSDQKIGAGDKIILLTAKPSWVAAVDGRVEPPTWKFLNYFEERLVRDAGARLVLTITGDRHHYARYEPEGGEGADEAPTRITAGGGGAYLSATHTLPERLRLKTLPRRVSSESYVEQPEVVNRREQIYPSAADSRRLSVGILKLAALNPAFGRLMGTFYLLLGGGMLAALDAGDHNLVTNAQQDTSFLFGFFDHAAGGLSITIAVLMLVGLMAGVDIKPDAFGKPPRGLAFAGRLGLAALQTALHVLIAGAAIRLVIEIASGAPTFWIWVLGLLVSFGAGALLGTTVFAAFMLLVHKVRKEKAQACSNQIFTGQSIPDYKNLLRMRLGPDGGLTIWPLGVDKACTEWQLADPKPAPRFEPRGTKPQVHPIDVPLRFDAKGNRLA
ncbi:MAG: hypothetical protein QOE31_2893 [Solirubrobacteraceae bacterium]|nr:hypothetical protein [Solirubrobacteraceae bacterium]